MAMTQNATAVAMRLEASSWKSWLAGRRFGDETGSPKTIFARFGRVSGSAPPEKLEERHGLNQRYQTTGLAKLEPD